MTADLFEDGRVRQSGPKERYVIPRRHRHLEEKASEHSLIGYTVIRDTHTEE